MTPPPALLLNQLDQLKNPDARVVLAAADPTRILGRWSAGCAGLQSGDYDRFGRCFWELPRCVGAWAFQQSTVASTRMVGGCEHSLLWEGGKGQLAGSPGAYIRGKSAWGKPGVAVSQTGSLFVARYLGVLFDNNTAVIVPHDPNHLPAIWCFCSSPEFNSAVRAIDQSLKVTNATLVQVPFDLDHWQKVAEEQYPNGLPEPYSDDPTQWLFHGHPSGSVVWDEQAKWTRQGPPPTDSTVLQVAVARLLGYRWPAEQDAEMRLADEQRHWVEKAAPTSTTAPDRVTFLTVPCSFCPVEISARVIMLSALTLLLS